MVGECLIQMKPTFEICLARCLSVTPFPRLFLVEQREDLGLSLGGDFHHRKKKNPTKWS